MTNPYASPNPSNDPQSSPVQSSFDATGQAQPSYSQSPYAQQPAAQTQGWGAPEGGWAQGQDYTAQHQSPYTPQQQGAYYAAPQTQNVYGTAPAQLTGPAAQIGSDGTACLILGVLGLVLLGLLGSVPAWIWGNSLVKKAKAMGLPEGTYSSAKIGMILGIVGTSIWIVAIVLVIVFFFIILGAAASLNSMGLVL